ncbi:MAG: phosphoribosylanthranilate isomerase [Bacteroidia bacterium]|nr:phosphoribosylanthranilate isomerase [Bacteroidia bacterium]
MKLKVCGMKYQDNLNQVAELQPDYLGFIFYDGSSRFFDGEIPQFSEKINKVGVFVNASLQSIIEKIKKYDLQAVQLHGEESPAFCESLKKQCKTDRSENAIKIIKVFSIKDEFNFDILRPFEKVCDYFLFDTKGKLPGGNGYTFDWKVLKDYPSTKPYFLSGGIGLNEIDDVLSFLRRQESKYCHAIDINSKFEKEPGLKDIAFIKEFKNKIF